MIDFDQGVFEDAHEDEVRAFFKAKGLQTEYGRYELMDMDTGETPGYLKGLRAIGEGCYLRRGATSSDDVNTYSELTGEQFVAIIGKDR